MRKTRNTKPPEPSAGSRIIASLKEAVDWAEGKAVKVRLTTVEVPMVDVKATRKQLGLSQSEFAARFGFQRATLRNWEQGRTRPDGPARVLLAVIARHPEAVEDAVWDRRVQDDVGALDVPVGLAALTRRRSQLPRIARDPSTPNGRK